MNYKPKPYQTYGPFYPNCKDSKYVNIDSIYIYRTSLDLTWYYDDNNFYHVLTCKWLIFKDYVSTVIFVRKSYKTKHPHSCMFNTQLETYAYQNYLR